ncbi:MAG: hypothetical protein WBE92_12040 [Steroidobacteraceae bacterium]
MWKGAVLTCVWAAVAVGGAARAAGTAPSCDRACLTGILDQYLAGLVAHDPSRVPFATKVKFTENNVQLRIGDGLWGTVSGIRHDSDLSFADPADGEVGYYGVVEEHGNPAYIALRLKVAGRKITEVESIVCRKGDGPGPTANFGALRHDPSFSETEPAKARSSRAQLIALANGYFSTLERNDGTLHTRFDPSCSRLEDGWNSAGDPEAKDPFTRLSCGGQFKLGYYRWDDRVRDRRFLVIDEERGLVAARMFIDHRAVLTDYTLTNGEHRVSPIKAPHTWCALELFKIVNGEIYRIEAVFIPVPYYMPSPWSRHTE